MNVRRILAATAVGSIAVLPSTAAITLHLTDDDPAVVIVNLDGFEIAPPTTRAPLEA